MADGILGHDVLPFVDPSEQRRSGNSERLLKFVSNNLEELSFGKLKHRFIARAAEETAEECAIFRSTATKFVMHECDGQDSFIFTTRHQKAKASRQLRPHDSIVN
jgi:hypothetical protein